jgi:DNA-binding GntR family transcriptional regulator
MDSPSEPLTRGLPMRDRVHTALEELIIVGTLQPGQRLIETELAERLGVSRNPIREAMQALSQAGWVDVRSRQGAYVHNPSDEEIRQFFAWRAMLEVQTARLAASNALPNETEDLQALLAVGQKALTAQDDEAVAAANTVFHNRVARLTHNDFYISASVKAHKMLRWFFRSVAISRGVSSWAEHAELLDALRAGDADSAGEITRQHTEATRTAFARYRLATRDGSGRPSGNGTRTGPGLSPESPRPVQS